MIALYTLVRTTALCSFMLASGLIAESSTPVDTFRSCLNDVSVHKNYTEYCITKKDFSCNGKLNKPVMIETSGYHRLCDDIDFVPSCNPSAAIVINASNVVLDLNGHVLNHANDKTQVTGIVVLTGNHNVTILGNYGAITNFSQRGIYVQGGCQQITIGNDTQLLVTGCGYGTPVTLIDGNQPIIQVGVQLGDMEYLEAFGFGKSHGRLNGLIVQNLISTDNNTGGALGDGDDYFFVNSSFSRNNDSRPIWPPIGYGYFGSKEEAVVCYGLAYFSSPELPQTRSSITDKGINGIKFENCSFDGNVADASVDPKTFSAYCDSFNMAVNHSDLKIKNCTFNNNNAILRPRKDITQFNQTRGCVISGGENIVIEDSEFCGNQGGGLVDGLNLSGLIPINAFEQTISQPKSVVLRNCVASNNRATTGGAVIANPGTTGSGSEGAKGEKALDVVGFVIRYPHGCSLINCVAEDNTGVVGADESDYYVFTDGILLFANFDYPDNPTNNVEIRGMKSSRNRNNAAQGTCSGIRILDGLCENVTIVDAVITENSFFNFQENFFAAGIDITGMTRNRPSLISVVNCIINNHASAGVFTSLEGTNIQGNILNFNTWGVLLGEYQEEPGAPIGYPNNSSILDNTLLSNDVAVEDQPSQGVPAVYSTSLVSNNQAFNNDKGYLVTYEGDVSVPVEFGTLSAYPAYPPSVQGSNLEFVQTTKTVKTSKTCSAKKACMNKNKIQNKRWKRLSKDKKKK